MHCSALVLARCRKLRVLQGQVEMSATFIGSYASQAPFVRAWWSKSHCRAAALGGGYGEVVFLIVLAVKQSRYDVRIRCWMAKVWCCVAGQACATNPGAAQHYSGEGSLELLVFVDSPSILRWVDENPANSPASWGNGSLSTISYKALYIPGG